MSPLARMSLALSLFFTFSGIWVRALIVTFRQDTDWPVSFAIGFLASLMGLCLAWFVTLVKQ